MKRVFYFCLAAMVTTLAASTVAAQSPSLGDYARAAKKTQKPAKASAKVYDNDNLPKSSSLSVVGRESAADQGADVASQDKDGDAADKKSEPAMKPGQPAVERETALAAWKAKLDDQKSQISLLSRELDVLKREHDIKASEFYSNPANRLQNNSFSTDDAKYKKQIAEKQKALDTANQKLADMQDQARKAGAPSSVTE
jgi:hypothetical protein